MPIWPMLMGAAGGGGPSGPILFDGTSAKGTPNTAAPATLPLVTSLTDNLLIAAWSGSRGSAAVDAVASVTSSSGLVWAPLIDVNGALDGGARHGRLSVWTAFSPGVLAAETVTFHLNGSVTCNCAAVAAFHGVVGSAGVYTLDGPTLSDANDSTHPSVTMTTTHANDLLVFAAMGVFPSTNEVAPTSFTTDAAFQESFGLFTGTLGLSHRIPVATQSGVVLEPASASGIGLCVAFAMKGS